MTEAFVYDAIRTPRGRGKNTGSLHATKPVSLVVGLLDEVRKRNPGLDPDRVEDIVLGCVAPIGEQGADIARTAALAAGYELSGPGFQLNRFCGSGLEAVNIAAQKVRSGWEDLVLAGGVESMSRVRGLGVLRPGATVGSHRHAGHRLDATGQDEVLPS